MIIDKEIKEVFDTVGSLIADAVSFPGTIVRSGKLLQVCIAQQAEIEFLYQEIEKLKDTLNGLYKTKYI
jgi:hypothetical protein